MARFDDMSYREQRDVLFRENEALKAEIITLKSDISLLDRGNLEAEIQSKWNLTPQRTQLLLILYRGRGRTVTKEFIHNNLPAGKYSMSREDTSLELINVQVCHLRRILGRSAIINTWGQGYALSPEVVAKIDAMRATDIAA